MTTVEIYVYRETGAGERGVHVLGQCLSRNGIPRVDDNDDDDDDEETGRQHYRSEPVPISYRVRRRRKPLG